MHIHENLAVLQSQRVRVRNNETETFLYTAPRKRMTQKAYQLAAMLGVTLPVSLVIRKHLLDFF